MSVLESLPALGAAQHIVTSEWDTAPTTSYQPGGALLPVEWAGKELDWFQWLASSQGSDATAGQMPIGNSQSLGSLGGGGGGGGRRPGSRDSFMRPGSRGELLGGRSKTPLQNIRLADSGGYASMSQWQLAQASTSKSNGPALSGIFREADGSRSRSLNISRRSKSMLGGVRIVALLPLECRRHPRCIS